MLLPMTSATRFSVAECAVETEMTKQSRTKASVLVIRAFGIGQVPSNGGQNMGTSQVVLLVYGDGTSIMNDGAQKLPSSHL